MPIRNNVLFNKYICETKEWKTKTLNKAIFLLTIFFIFSGFFYAFYHYLILDMNEGLYAEVAREMLTSKSYLIPILNHVPYIEKPPLLYWLIMLSYKVFGISTFAARLIPVISSAGVALLLVLLGRQNNHFRAGCFAAIVFATSIFTAIIGRVVFFDMLLTAGITASLLAFFCWYKTDTRQYLYAAYFFLALAFLAKGMMAVCIIGGVVILFMLLQRVTSKKLQTFFNPVGVAIFFLIISPWIIVATLKQPGFVWDYFINEQSYRFFNIRVPHDYHNGSILYYIPRVFVYLFPWSLLIPTLLQRWHGKIAEQEPFKLFLWCWFLFALLFFSLAGNKGDYYMIVGAPPLAMLLGLSLEKLVNKNQHVIFAGLFYLLSWGGIITTLWMLFIPSMGVPNTAHTVLLCTLAYFIVYCLVGSFLIFYFKKALINFLLIAGFAMPIINFYVNLRHLTENDFTQATLSSYIYSHDSTRKTYLFRDYEEISSILFFLQRPLPIIDTVSRDLYYGFHADSKQAAQWFIGHQQFLETAKQQPVYVILLKKRFSEFRNLVWPLHFCAVARSGTALVVTNAYSQTECLGSVDNVLS